MQLPLPTGQIVPSVDGYDLVLLRSLPVALDDTWAHITEPESTARLIGTWEGDGTIAQTARLQLGFEDGQPWTELLFTMHGVDPSSFGEIGPGWDYYPAQQEYFQAQVR